MDIKQLNEILKTLHEEKLKLSQERSEEIINNLIEYIKNINADVLDDTEDFWNRIIGMTDEEIKYFSL